MKQSDKYHEIKREHTGQLNFYLNAIDELMKHPHDNLSIGLLLCKSRDKVIAEYTLKGIETPDRSIRISINSSYS